MANMLIKFLETNRAWKLCPLSLPGAGQCWPAGPTAAMRQTRSIGLNQDFSLADRNHD